MKKYLQELEDWSTQYAIDKLVVFCIAKRISTELKINILLIPYLLSSLYGDLGKDRFIHMTTDEGEMRTVFSHITEAYSEILYTENNNIEEIFYKIMDGR